MNRRAILRFAVIAAIDVFLLAMMITACVTAGHMMDDLDEAGKLAGAVGGMVGIALWLFMLMVFVNLYADKCELERRIKSLETRMEALEKANDEKVQEEVYRRDPQRTTGRQSAASPHGQEYGEDWPSRTVHWQKRPHTRHVKTSAADPEDGES